MSVKQSGEERVNNLQSQYIFIVISYCFYAFLILMKFIDSAHKVKTAWQDFS